MSYINIEPTAYSSIQIDSSSHPNFSSQNEWFPWCQITLPSPARIEGLQLEGWARNDGQPPLLSVLLSDDGEEWLPVWSQALLELETTDNFSITFPQTFSARHVRLRADCLGMLKFQKISFATSPCTDSDISISEVAHSYAKQALESQVILASLFNESDKFLEQYLDNFLAYTPRNVCLILNMPPGRAIPEHLKDLHPRIHLFNGEIKREKWGHTLLLGYIESIKQARHVFPNFNYFTTMSSNSLLVRNMDIAAAIAQLPLASRVPVASERSYERDQNIDVLKPTQHGTWMWHHYRNSEGLGQYLFDKLQIEKLSITQIEGLFARREDWELILECRDIIAGFDEFISYDNFMALEELLPTSVFNTFGSGQYTHICRVLWSGTRQVTLDDLLDMAPCLPAHFCSLKWFDRDTTAQPTTAVTTQWGRYLLEMGQGTNNSLARFQETTLAQTFLARARQAERFGPLTNRWWNQTQHALNGLHWSARDLPCVRQLIDLDIPHLKPTHTSPAFLFMEATGLLLSISISIHETTDNKTRLRVSCSATTQEGTPISGIHLQAYLYLSGLCGDTVFKMTIPHGSCSPPGILGRTVFHDQHSYIVDHADRIEHEYDHDKYYFVRKARNPHEQVWLGLPIHCNATFEILLSTGPDFYNVRTPPLECP